MESEVSTGETDTPTTDKPFDSRSRCRALNSGISARQGWHHVAQKFSSTTRPCSDERRIAFPSRASNSTSGAGTKVELETFGAGAETLSRLSRLGSIPASLELASRLE